MADTSDDTKSKVDAALYPAGKVPSDGRPKWAHAELYIEFKQGDTKNDPWDDRDRMSAESDAIKRADVRAQLIAYAHNTFRYQQRTALYSLLVIGREFRAARWDRSGVIVSRKVDYVEHTDLFLEFLWRFAQLDPVQQGLDPTATLLEKDAHAFRMMDYLARPDPSVDVDYMDTNNAETVPVPAAAESATEVPDVPLPPPGAPPEGDDPDLAVIEECGDDPRVFKYVREKFKESLEHNWPRYKLCVGKEERVFLVGKPIFVSSSLFGRATRGYVAVDAKTRRFVFLKDSWRPFYEGVDPEGTYLKKLSKDKALFVPAYLCDGDVGHQTAYTAIYEGEPERRRLRAARRRRAAAQAKVAASADAVAKESGTKKRSRELGDVGEPQDAPSAANLALLETEDSLRHHIHYRIVMKDVCLPFDRFRSSKELVRLIYHCVSSTWISISIYWCMLISLLNSALLGIHDIQPPTS